MTAVVTGAGTGIGKAITLELVKRGITVYAVGRRIEKLLETQNASKNPQKVTIIQADVSSEDGRNKIAQVIGKAPIKYLVHNAGAVGPLKPLEELEIESFRKVMELNVEAPIFLTKKLLKNLSEEKTMTGKPARILHVSSGCAHNPTKSWLTYSVSKAAFLMAYKCLALDLAPNILVGSFKPGIVDTEMQTEMRLATEDDFPKVSFFKKLKEEKDKFETELKPHMPSRERLDNPENTAFFAWFLLSSTTDEEYSTQDWDIRDESLFQRWSEV